MGFDLILDMTLLRRSWLNTRFVNEVSWLVLSVVDAHLDIWAYKSSDGLHIKTTHRRQVSSDEPMQWILCRSAGLGIIGSPISTALKRINRIILGRASRA